MATEPEIEDLKQGVGRPAVRRDIVEIRLTTRLARGEAVIENHRLAFQLGTRSVIAGLEKGVAGMRKGGLRRISFGPHLGYRDKGVGNIPPNARLVCEVELLGLFSENDPEAPVGIQRMTGRNTAAAAK